MEVAHPRSGSLSIWFLVELEFENVGFWGDGKTGVPGGKHLGARENCFFKAQSAKLNTNETFLRLILYKKYTNVNKWKNRKVHSGNSCTIQRVLKKCVLFVYTLVPNSYTSMFEFVYIFGIRSPLSQMNPSPPRQMKERKWEMKYPASRGYIFAVWAVLRKVAFADNRSIFHHACAKFVMRFASKINCQVCCQMARASQE